MSSIAIVSAPGDNAQIASKGTSLVSAPPASSSTGDNGPPTRGPPFAPCPDGQGTYHIDQFTQKIEIYSGSKSGTNVVIKVYHKSKMQPKHHHKLAREIEIMERMNGAYCTELFGTFSNNDSICLVMEYCEGGDLFKSMMKHGGCLDEHYVCVEVIAPLLRVLEKMHRQGIMHRDIKPENIFLTRSGRMRLGDFGLAMDWCKEIPFSRSGTLDYMAPEVLVNPATQLQESPSVDIATLEAKGIKPFTCAVDIWAAGVLAYELVGGRPPFEVEDEVKTVTRIIYCNSITFPEGFSPMLMDFVRHALIKDPNMRPDARTLLSHPWIQANLQAAIASAPSLAHRHAKEELLRPLSLTPRAPQRIPVAVPSKPNLTLNSSIGTYRAPAIPLTPQHARGGGGATAGQPTDVAAMHLRLKSHLNLREASYERELLTSEGAGGDGKTATGAMQQQQQPIALAALGGGSGLERHSSCPSSQTMLMPQAYGTPATVAYRPSPLSRKACIASSSATAPYTPTKTSRPAETPDVAAPASSPTDDQQSKHTSQLHQARLQLLQMQAEAKHQASAQMQQLHVFQQQRVVATHVASAAPSSKMDQQQMLADPSPGPGGNSMEMLMQAAEGAAAHGVVQISRASSLKADPGTLLAMNGAAVSHGGKVQDPASPLPALSVPHLLQRLCIPVGTPNGLLRVEDSPTGYQPSPGPAGPGIKERVKWHLARQAGSN